MKKLIVALVAGALMSTTSGCMTVTEGQQTFAISAQKIVIGKSFADAVPRCTRGCHRVEAREATFGVLKARMRAPT